MIDKLKKSVLEDKDNDLSYIVESFLKSDEECWHIDRHVIQVGDNQIISNSISIIYAVCQIALYLLKKWINQRNILLKDAQCNISKPYLMIDDEWLNDNDTTAPPHVYICLTKKMSNCIPVEHENTVEVEKTGNIELDQILSDNYKLKRLPASFGEDFGAWIVEIP